MGDRWTTVGYKPSEHCVFKDGEWFADAASKAHAEKLVGHLDAYEARIAELEAEQGRLRQIILDDAMELARVKAESLRVVPDGEACDMTGISMFSLFTCDHDGVWLKFGLDSWHYYARNIITGEETTLLDSVRVQHVRLEHWETTE